MAIFLLFQFKNLYPDGGMTIVAERAWRHSYTVTSTSTSASGVMRTRTTIYTRDIAGEMMVLKTKADGTVAWISVLPKKQIHLIQGNYGTGISLIFRKYHTAFWPCFIPPVCLRKTTTCISFSTTIPITRMY